VDPGFPVVSAGPWTCFVAALDKVQCNYCMHAAHSVSKFKVSNNVKQNIDETHSNNKKSLGKSCQPMDFKNLKKKIFEPKVL
jgi:hypothetical protein